MIHRRNNYDLNVFNGDIGTIREINAEELTLAVSFFPDGRIVEYTRDAAVRAREIAKSILAQEEKSYISAEMAQAIRKKYNIIGEA